MRLDLNLSPQPFQNRNLLYAGLIFCSALALGLTIYNTWSATSSWRKLHSIVSSHNKQEWDIKKGEEMKMVLRAEIDALEQRRELSQVAFVNRQIDRASLSWVRLLDWMEATMPPAVILMSINPTITEHGNVSLSIRFRARTLDAALNFMRRMRNSKAFSSVNPLSESVSQGNAGIEYLITASYNPSIGPPPPPPADKESGGEETNRGNGQ